MPPSGSTAKYLLITFPVEEINIFGNKFAVMDEIKAIGTNLTKTQKIIIISFFIIGILICVAILFGFQSSEKSKVNNEILRSMEKQNEQLTESNSRLLLTVQSLNVSIAQRARFDSINLSIVELNNAKISQVNQSLSNLKNLYDKIPSYSNYNADSILRYFATH
jgi:hypothetical protein